MNNEMYTKNMSLLFTSAKIKGRAIKKSYGFNYQFIFDYDHLLRIIVPTNYS